MISHKKAAVVRGSVSVGSAAPLCVDPLRVGSAAVVRVFAGALSPSAAARAPLCANPLMHNHHFHQACSEDASAKCSVIGTVPTTLSTRSLRSENRKKTTIENFLENKMLKSYFCEIG